MKNALPLHLRLIKPFWKVWALLILRKYDGYFTTWTYAEGLWEIMIDSDEGFMTPRECLEIDQQYWED